MVTYTPRIAKAKSALYIRQIMMPVESCHVRLLQTCDNVPRVQNHRNANAGAHKPSNIAFRPRFTMGERPKKAYMIAVAMRPRTVRMDAARS